MENHLWYYRKKLHITAKQVLLMWMLLFRPALALELAIALELAFTPGLVLTLDLSPALVLELAFELLLSK